MAELTGQEIEQTPMPVHEKVLMALNEWEGWADKAEALPCVQK